MARIIIVSLIVVFLSISCSSDPKDKPLTETNLKAAQVSESLSAEDKQLLTSYMMKNFMKAAFSGQDSAQVMNSLFDSSMTIADVIEKQRSQNIEDSIQKEEEQILAQQQLAESEAKLAALKNTVMVTLLEKEFIKVDYQEYITIKYAIKNNSEKNILGVKGALELQDIFGDKIIRLEIKVDDLLIAGNRSLHDGVYNYNQFMDEQKTFKATPFEKIVVVWEPHIVIFEDGTRLELSNLQ